MEENTRIRIRNLKWLERLGGTIEEDSKDEPRDSLPVEGDPSKPSVEEPRQECKYPLPEGCSPVEWVALHWEVVTAHRYFKCEYYGDCLEYAGLSAWQGMSCSRCRRFIAAKPLR